MARSRVQATVLARLLNSVPQPVYVLDDELTVIFVNRACVDWLGPAAEGILGSRAAYHSEPEVSGPQSVAAGLCPPPEVLGGSEVSATVPRAGDRGQVSYRQARFLPVGARPDDTFAVIAILETEDLPQPATDTTQSREPSATELHERIERFRREAAGRYRADWLLGKCPAIRRVRRQVELAAASRASVLLVGPSGSGRRHTAGAIHYRGTPDSAGTLVPLACSVLDGDLIRSTVTALVSGDVFADESAHGTLLLNDVDELSDEVQAELAAEFVDRPLAMRLIATAKQPLVALARKERYREDLAAALSTITVELPPLIQRREDIPLLSQLFLEEANARGARQISCFTPEALDALHGHGWPGNIAELAQVVAQAHGQTAGPRIGVDDLPEQIHFAAHAAARPPREEETIVLDEFLGRVERELIRRALGRSKGNKAKAARLLGMTRPRLYRRMQQLGLLEE